MTPQVIAVGYPRTGTQSLAEALTLLGYNVLDNPTVTVEDCGQVDFPALAKDYTAASGLVFAVCLEEVLAAFPDAYYILTHRASVEEWYTSWITYHGALRMVNKYSLWVPNTYKKRQHWPTNPIKVRPQQSYLKHLYRVRTLVPEDRLLELQLSQNNNAWDPLCGFLNVSVPEGMAFPQWNTSRQVVWKCRLLVVASNLVLLLVLWGVTKFFTRKIKEAPEASEKEETKEPDEQDSDKDKEEEDYVFVPQVKLLPDDDDTTTKPLLSIDQLQQLAQQALPPGVALRCWQRLYRLSRDGDDFQTFLKAVQGHAQTLLVIQTTRHQFLGAFADSPWDASEKGFYGSTQACLWAFGSQLSVYKWTGSNRFLQLVDKDRGRIAFGGTTFGLSMEDHFSKGTSAPCETFGTTESLTGDKEEQFAILDVEVFTFPRGTLS